MTFTYNQKSISKIVTFVFFIGISVIPLTLLASLKTTNESFKNQHYISITSLSFAKDSSDNLSKFLKKGYSKGEITLIPKGKRPLPSNYLKRRYIRRHVRSFKRGASFLIPEAILDKFGRSILGRSDGQFVMNKNDMDDLLAKAHGQIIVIETELGIPSGLWQHGRIIRIDIPKPKRLHIRIPSGNEIGANELWIPGGKLPNGYSESVIDPIPKGKYTETLILLK